MSYPFFWIGDLIYSVGIQNLPVEEFSKQGSSVGRSFLRLKLNGFLVRPKFVRVPTFLGREMRSVGTHTFFKNRVSTLSSMGVWELPTSFF